MTMAKFVKYTDPDGNVMDAILLSSAADSGEGSTADVLIPLDRGGGIMANVEASQGTGPGTWMEA
jgi:hypothetical protein